MVDVMPAGGWPMRGALYTLQHPDHLDAVALAEQYKSMEAFEHEPSLRVTRGILWNNLVERANLGQIVFRGAVAGEKIPSPIDPLMLRGAVPDFAGDSIQAGGTIFHVVTVIDAGSANQAAVRQTSDTGRQPTGRTPEHGDDFIQEMLRFAILEDCPSKKVLTDHMKAWCLTSRGENSPNDRTVERWVTRYWPSGL